MYDNDVGEWIANCVDYSEGALQSLASCLRYWPQALSVGDFAKELLAAAASSALLALPI